MNTLNYSDNLNILRDHIKGERVDLIFLDPPFNSNRMQNIPFKTESLKKAEKDRKTGPKQEGLGL